VRASASLARPWRGLLVWLGAIVLGLVGVAGLVGLAR
jgi:hypothetical protein